MQPENANTKTYHSKHMKKAKNTTMGTDLIVIYEDNAIIAVEKPLKAGLRLYTASIETPQVL